MVDCADRGEGEEEVCQACAEGEEESFPGVGEGWLLGVLRRDGEEEVGPVESYNVDPTQLLCEHDDDGRDGGATDAAKGEELAGAPEVGCFLDELRVAFGIEAGGRFGVPSEVLFLDLNLFVKQVDVAGCEERGASQAADGVECVEDTMLFDVPSGGFLAGALAWKKEVSGD